MDGRASSVASSCSSRRGTATAPCLCPLAIATAPATSSSCKAAAALVWRLRVHHRDSASFLAGSEVQSAIRLHVAVSQFGNAMSTGLALEKLAPESHAMARGMKGCDTPGFCRCRSLPNAQISGDFPTQVFQLSELQTL